MASVSSLDKDLRRVRLDKYTPAASKEARQWIESVLNERLPSSDLLDALKDGVALCRLINLAVPPPGVKFKQSTMPFVQMENISHFLRACQAPPLNLHQHDMFLTVDLFENKDPAQVLQCLGAFSRAAHRENPNNFPTSIGPKSKGSILSPQSTGPPSPIRNRGMSNASNTSGFFASRPSPATVAQTAGSEPGRRSPNKSPASPGVQVSSWSRKEHEGSTDPAWNIAQYGYLGGASQGNLGITFGGRRQITSAEPRVLSIAEKLRLQKVEEEHQRLQMEEEEEEEEARRRRKAELEAEERAREEEEGRWQEETRRLRDEERRKAEDERLRWEEEERRWKITEENRKREEAEAEARLAQERQHARSRSDVRLRGQYLSQYQAEQVAPKADDDGYSGRIKQLEKELELARQREREYELERAERAARRNSGDLSGLRVRARSKGLPRPPSRQDSWSTKEREILRTPKSSSQLGLPQAQDAAAAVAPPPPPAKAPRPLPDPAKVVVKTHHTGGSSRPLPDPAAYAKPAAVSPPASVAQAPPAVPVHGIIPISSPNPAPSPPYPLQQTYSRELDSTAERDAEDRRREKSQAVTKEGGRESKSLLEREMEMERQRQREWEEAQRETANAAKGVGGGDAQVDGIGGRWDVSQWSGFTGGDGQNRGSQGIGANRRPITGPRPLPNTPR